MTSKEQKTYNLKSSEMYKAVDDKKIIVFKYSDPSPLKKKSIVTLL